MNELKYPHLFAPIRLGKTMFRNRLFGSPTGFQDLTSEGFPPAEMCAYYERKAMGGAASVAVGECIVDSKRGMGGPNHVPLDNPELVGPLTNVALAIAKYGAVPVVELQHAGMFAEESVKRGGEVFAPVEMDAPQGAVVHAEEDTGPIERIPAMPLDVIEQTIEAYGDAAAFAKFCGFGMALIHGGHGWMLSQWLSPLINTRTDEWGGSLENRMRLPLAIIENIRKKCGHHFPIEFRMSVTEANEGGYGIDEGLAIAKMLDQKVDIIHASAGNHEVRDAFVITHPSLFAPDGVNAYLAEAIKKSGVQTPVATVGAFTEPELMEEVIASGKADIVNVARGLIADPDLPLKARTGRDADITRCLRCFTCFSFLLTNQQFCCAVNPEIGQEIETKFSHPAPHIKKTVLVAGGGVGGMEAALTAAGRGHHVILCEKTGRLGGALRCEEKVPFKKALDDYLNLQEKRVKESAIDLRLNTAVTPELAKDIAPDVIIAALGAKALKPPIPGIDGPHVKSAEDVYVNPELAGDKVIILGAGFVGTELGIYLKGLGKEVEIIEMLPGINDAGNVLHGLAVDVKLREEGIPAHFSTRAIEITPNGVIGEKDGAKTIFDADTVIYAVGQIPLWDEAESLNDCAPEFHIIGDALAPKNIREATKGGYFTALNIGRV
ncbi:MAG: NAD(P)/FAD-dependent oxidoreductase [Clostridiales Family XIII bacterium]|jgi:2,4-dienoyl-CoA reductase-like NADH-dependent reductase (Old Yellow Enzyme family)/thioredoxin reductase|nr:NAD(P)/FAD-dependent oxidoreductase [Clostridiales Family XIII bacterium]